VRNPGGGGGNRRKARRPPPAAPPAPRRPYSQSGGRVPRPTARAARRRCCPLDAPGLRCRQLARRRCAAAHAR